MNYNPNIHHRRTIRLQTYDYSNEGLYFVTICTHNRQPLFGQIVNDEMELNDAGRMVEKQYHLLEQKYSNVTCREYIVMPNHFHCIIQITDNEFVGAGSACPKTSTNTTNIMHSGGQTPPLRNITLGQIVGYFKYQTTKNVNFNKRLWQRNYYEHIIRTQHSYEEIVTYILENPKRWSKDSLYIKTP